MKKHSLSIILFFLCLVLSDVFSQTKVDWRQIKNTPTTVSGYGITDTVSIDSLNSAVEEINENIASLSTIIASDTLEILREEIPTNASFTFQGLSDTWNTVETNHIADEAVTTAKIDDGAVNVDKLGANAVTSDKIPTGAILNHHIYDGQITTQTLADNAVTADKISDGAVTDAKIESISSRKLTGDLTTADVSVAIHADTSGNYPPTIHRAETVTNTRGLYLSGGDSPVSEGLEGFSIFLGSATDPFLRMFSENVIMMQMFPPSMGLSHPISFKYPVLVEGDLQISNKLGVFNWDAVNQEAYNMSFENAKGAAVLDSDGHKLKIELDSSSAKFGIDNSVNRLVLREERQGYVELVTPNNAILTLKGGETAASPLKPGQLDLYRGQALLSVEDTSTSDASSVFLDSGNITSQASQRINLYAGDDFKLVLKDGVASLTGKLDVSGDTVVAGKLTVDGVNGLRVTGVAGAYIDSALAVGGNISHGSTSGSTPNLIISGGTTASNGSTLELSTGFKNKIELKTTEGDTKLTMEDGSVTITGGLNVLGDFSVDGDSLSIPNNASFTLAGLSEKSYNSLTDKPTVGFDFLKTSIDSFSCAEFEQYPTLLSAPVLRLITMPSELTTPHIFEWINASYSVGIATYTDGPTHGKSDNAFYGSTLMPNGKVMLTPYKSANIGIYDPATDTYTNGPTHGKSANAFFGSTLMPNGKVMLVPANSTTIGIYDPIANTYTDGPAHGVMGNLSFSGCTLMPNGKVMLTPYNSANIGIYDPATDTYTNGPTHGKSANAFFGGTLMPNGKVMLTPYSSANIGIYDPATDTYTDGPLHGRDGSAFAGSTMLPNGKVMLTPRNSANIGIYDPATDTYTDGPTHGKSDNAFFGGTLMPNGKVMLVPYSSANIGIYDPATDTYTDGPLHGRGGGAFFGSTLMPNGKVMLTPCNSANIGIYDPAIIDLELRDWPLLSAYFNKF